jgi:hypothetical protein
MATTTEITPQPQLDFDRLKKRISREVNSHGPGDFAIILKGQAKGHAHRLKRWIHWEGGWCHSIQIERGQDRQSPTVISFTFTDQTTTSSITPGRNRDGKPVWIYPAEQVS